MNDHPFPHDEATIAAIITPPGVGGIAAVRLSGAGAFDVAMKILGERDGRERPMLAASHRARLMDVFHPADGTALDQALVLPMHAPATFSGEDTVEFFCHGGSQPAALVLEACLCAGARAAGPGEFTRRAFLNGRLSLDQAEAVADLIHAADRLGARAALARLRGGLRNDIDTIERPLLQLLSELEGSLEFTEDDNVFVPRDHIIEVLSAAVVHIDALLDSKESSRRIRDGVQVVIAGPTNAGKSSLFNALLGRPRALVDTEAGTTRDIISATLVIDGVTFELHDTAGLREGGGRVEAAGIGLTREALAEADIVLWLTPLDGDGAAEPELPADVALLPVGTRSDLVTTGVGDASGLRTSARTGAGLDDLRTALAELADTTRLQEVARTGRTLAARHQGRLEDCRGHLCDLGADASQQAPDEVLATELGQILSQLGEVTGRVYSERLLGEVFAGFCVGK